jgi:hypothetical protein
MNEENKNTKVYAALAKAQQEFTPVFFDCINPHFKTKYASLASCLDSVKKAFNKHGLFLTQKHHNMPNSVGVETIVVHESGESLSSDILYVPVDKQSPQGFGSALTYARRYSLMTFCGIAGEQDDDANMAEEKIKENKEIKTAPVQNKNDDILNIKINDAILKYNPEFKGLTYKEAAEKNPERFGVWISKLLASEQKKTDYQWKERNINNYKMLLDYVVTISPKDEIPF